MKKVLIIGRPNVGKSSLFNKLIRKRRALVMDIPGVTRDIIKGQTTWWGGSFEVWDCGGILLNSNQIISRNIYDSVLNSLTKADLIVMVMDGKMGLHEDDKKIFNMIRDKKYLLVVNKVDQKRKLLNTISEFHGLGAPFIETSFEKEINIDQIVSWILEHETKIEEDDGIKNFSIMLTGQPNVGKSSLFNQMIKKDRSQISPIAHTTVDVVDDSFFIKDIKYDIFDSAGIGKRTKQPLDIQKLAAAKTLSYYDKIDLMALVLDATKPIARQDIRLLSYCLKKYKPFIIVMNKWDLAEKETTKLAIREQLADSLSFYLNIPIHFTSAISGVGVNQLSQKIQEMQKRIQTKISTAHLNRFLIAAVKTTPQPVYGTRNIKFYYLTQVETQPPSFVIFTNEPKGVPASYRKFLEKKIQKEWDLQGIPIKIYFKKKK